MEKEKSNRIIDMDKASLEKLDKSQLIKLLLKQKKPKIILIDDIKPVPTPRTYKPVPARRRPVPTPRKSVKDMVKQYEDNIILPPPEVRDRPVPKPRTKKPLQAPIPTPRTKKQTLEKPVPEKRTIITQVEKALKGYTQSFEVELRDEKDPLVQLQNTRKGIESHIKDILTPMKGIKYIETLKVRFEKLSGDEIVFKTAYFNSPAQTIISQIEIAGSLQLTEQDILKKIAQWVSKGSGWTIKSVDSHYINCKIQTIERIKLYNTTTKTTKQF